MNALIHIDWADDYRQYFELRNKGLRKQASNALNIFLEKYKTQDKNSRRHFLDIVNRLAFSSKEYSTYLPYNLSQDIFKKEIKSWIEEEPQNPIPYKWSYEFDLIRKSLELDPFDQETLLLYGSMLINTISMNQHEINSGFSYHGDPAADLQLLQFYKPFLMNIIDSNKRQEFARDISELEECVLKINGA